MRFTTLSVTLCLLTTPLAAQTADSALARGERLLSEGRGAEAGDAVRPLADSHARAALLLGRIAWDAGRTDEAVRWFERAVALDTSAVDARIRLGRAYAAQVASVSILRKRSVAARALSQLDKAVSLDPRSVEARQARVEYYLAAPGIAGGGVDKARAEAATAKRLDAYRGGLLVGRVEERDNKPAAAEAEYRALIAAFPDSSAPTAALAALYQSQQRLDDAFRLIDARLASAPDDYTMLYALGRASALSGQRLEQGEAALRRYLARPNPRAAANDAAAHYRLGIVLERRGDVAGARAEFELALRIDPRHGEAKRALDRLGRHR